MQILLATTMALSHSVSRHKIKNSSPPQRENLSVSRTLLVIIYEMLKIPEAPRVNWERSTGVPELFNKHLDILNGKYMVFCENIDHLSEMIEEVRKWFKKSTTLRKQRLIEPVHYIAYSDLGSKVVNEALTAFNTADANNNVHLMFSINMFNEGLHLKGVNSVILLRKTSSPLLHTQQIGRCLEIGEESETVIFDLVSNAENLQTSCFYQQVNDVLKAENNIRKQHGLEPSTIRVHVIDEAKYI